MHSVLQSVVTLLGFILSSVWIFIIAQHLVMIMQFLSFLGGFRESYVGLTIFALSNSLGDFAANIALARAGYVSMAIGACFGSPLLNILLGLGVASFTAIQSSSSSSFDIENSNSLLLITLLAISALVVSAAGFLVAGFRINARLGTLLIACWAIMTVTVVVEGIL